MQPKLLFETKKFQDKKGIEHQLSGKLFGALMLFYIDEELVYKSAVFLLGCRNGRKNIETNIYLAMEERQVERSVIENIIKGVTLC